MDILFPFALGFEVQRFAATNDTADALSGSLDALQSGAWTLSPYEGPAIQPYIQLTLDKLSLGLAPAASWRQVPATAADGRDGTLRVSQWMIEGRIHWQQGPARFGMDGGFSSGSAQINGETVAQATQMIRIAPSAGLAIELVEDLSAIGRVLWPIQIFDEGFVHGPSAAMAIEWRP
jgi:hypothetical protein